ncbi:MAG TPA: CbiX/SirB N-terminal domain-containing protein [Dehalococcoidales bacterium]|nr:CbiX/SirB N-terminal domain-containing protein [Dehalococcoidales bacterium]
MKTIVVLAMHGIPPNDFPRKELAEFFRLHYIVESMSGPISQEIQSQYAVLHKKMRDWPRNNQNDPFQAASNELAASLNKQSGYEVLVGYNEFCSPSLDEALRIAAQKEAERILVTTPMMTRGGEHSEKDIPSKIQEFQTSHPQIEVVYAWPFDPEKVAGFLSAHISQFL